MNRLTVPGRIILALIVAAAIFFLVMKFMPKSTGVKNDGKTSDAYASENYDMKLVGSNTIGSELAPALINAWLQSKNATNIERKNLSRDETEIKAEMQGKTFTVYIQASGTKNGINALENGKAEIAMASDEAEEQDLLSADNEHVIGLDGIAVIVNQANQLSHISMATAARVFSGDIKDWKDVPGAGMKGPINLYSRDANSGTNAFFNKVVMQGAAKANAKEFEDSKALADAVAQDPIGIGFISYTFVSAGVKALAINAGDRINPLLPTVMSIQSEQYPLCRRLYLYTRTNMSNNDRDFIHFVEFNGQNIVNNVGFIGLDINTGDAKTRQDEIRNEPATYSRMVASSYKLSLEFRFMTGSYTMDTRALADKVRLEKLLSQPKNRGKKVLLIGFTDNVGNPSKNIKLSLERANAVRDALMTEGVTNITTAGFGDAKPLNENATDAQRMLNRRVEVWIGE